MKQFLYIFLVTVGVAQAQSSLSVNQIMQDPNWMGYFPSNVKWGEQSEHIYFNYNPEQNTSDSLYQYSLSSGKISEVLPKIASKLIPSNAITNADGSLKIFIRNGNLFRYNTKKDEQNLLLDLPLGIVSPVFLTENNIAFVSDRNLYKFTLDELKIEQLTFLTKGKAPDTTNQINEKKAWLESENLKLLAEVKTRQDENEARDNYRKQNDNSTQKYYLGKEQPYNFNISKNGRYVTFQTYVPDSNGSTIVPDYTDASGYTKDLRARSKVGDQTRKTALYLYNTNSHEVLKIAHDGLPDITKLPEYTKDYPDKTWENKVRPVTYSEVYFSDNSKHAVVDIRTQDNKDRYITAIDLATGELKSLDHQHDEAWIGGPGINGYYNGGILGWLPDNTHFYYQSEATGFSHLYLHNINTNQQKQLTQGNYEVFDPQLSKNKKDWYFTSSKVDLGERHFYKMPVMGGKQEQLTSMKGHNQVRLSPDEKYLAIRYSNANTPWELYLKRNRAKATPKQITTGQSEAFKAYNWRTPELIQFEANDGETPVARLYKPTPENAKEAAVIFVHGAGYLQNAHHWWSSYFREYMFHNLLTDLGYTVLDIDYRGSAGYGRDWRTAIYRHMGGKDLSDQVDGAKYLVSEHGINPEKVGIYGGSYGGFITLMALFNEADSFAAGAALRSVTDWAHYNHTYTKNILNEPHLDPIAYRRSSPIYFAEGLEDPLLIAHGMIDTNVHFQDVVRLSQRLIELEKENWEMAVYPVEGHGFQEPSSWTDEYRRILELFESTIGQ